jgi:hypothetical protein
VDEGTMTQSEINGTKTKILIDESAIQHMIQLSLSSIPQDLLALCPIKISTVKGNDVPIAGSKCRLPDEAFA